MSAFPIDYHLPPELIAQDPVEPRDAARLLVVDRARQALGHFRFRDLPQLLSPGDLLILNDTRVLPARLLGRRQATGGKWEGLFLKPLDDGAWEMLCQTRGRLTEGEIIEVSPSAADDKHGYLFLTLEQRLPEGRWRVRPSQHESPGSLMDRFGHVPLPPYIRKGHDRPEDRHRYQTIFAEHPGAVAAPTAGLHFTPGLFEALSERGIERAFVTLHVGLGTFRPIDADDYRRHAMHAEWGELPEATVHALHQCKGRGGRVIAVGTTAVRVLETAAQTATQDGALHPWRGDTSLFIYAPYAFRVVDGLITNFHLPRTTLLLLVAAFAGVELLERAYAAAIAERYRFFSYGDAMLIV
ncbi:MAG: tRNA preQ1(34) S-adenosylmethionine ribosyltransferase-isomerase QueA [Gemmataceae bacterium]|nr:tRNA preQ1(34) S-adenosylmethionine ribosyltransferase-isomerase QueA [Gemmataceae bacterium]